MKRLGLWLLLLSACEDAPPPPPPPLKARKQEAVQTRTEASSQPTDQYVYSPIGKRDPFRPFYVDQQIEEEEKEQQRIITELERFELDQLKLVAVIGGTSQPRAMFEDPTGKGWTVTIGTAIGRHGGKVTKIKKDEVVVTEEYRDPVTNKKMMSPVAVKLPADEMQLEH